MEENNSSNTSIEKDKRQEVIIDVKKIDASIEQYKRKELKIDDKERLKPASRCCIYRVPRNLRQVKEDAYTPLFISIGPLHHGNPKLANMEKQKLRYKEDFCKRHTVTEERWKDLYAYIKEKEQDIRDHYEDTSHLQGDKFIIMILLDAIFIIELFLKFKEKNIDFLLKNPRLRIGIWLDLQLIENQLPFFVPKELYELVRRRTGELTPLPFDDLSCTFFDVRCEAKFQHFVDLRRNFYAKNLPHSKKEGQIEDLPSAVKLHASGVKFEKAKDDEKCLLDINFEKGRTCIQIPRIKIEDSTEYLFRNMIALEQCHYPSETHICNYVDLMDSLIDTAKDVDLLIEKEIISNCVGEPVRIATMFNQLRLQATPSDNSCYKDISEELKEHNKKWWNGTKATLMRTYFPNLWTGTGTVAASIILVFTLLEAIYSTWGMIRY